MKKTNKFFVIYTFVLFFVFIFLFSTSTFCAYPKLVNKIFSAFESVKEWIIKIATPAAAVAVRNRYIYEKI